MSKKMLIIIAAIIIIIALVIGVLTVMPTPEKQFSQTSGKQDSRLVITSNSTLKVGDNITVKLTDIKGKPIKNETVNITILGQDGSKSYNSVVTDKFGIGTLKLEKSAGKYTNNVTFGGNEEYAGSNTSQKYIIE